MSLTGLLLTELFLFWFLAAILEVITALNLAIQIPYWRNSDPSNYSLLMKIFAKQISRVAMSAGLIKSVYASVSFCIFLNTINTILNPWSPIFKVLGNQIIFSCGICPTNGTSYFSFKVNRFGIAFCKLT